MEAMQAAENLGIKLESQGDLLLWEVMPSPAHTKAVQRVQNSIALPQDGSGCGCFAYQDMYVRFPNGDHLRPDLALYCEEPPDTQEACRLLPLAVLEVISPGSEMKDLQILPPFYLAQGVLDVLVLNPRTGVVTHFRRDGTQTFNSPQMVHLEMGCSFSV